MAACVSGEVLRPRAIADASTSSTSSTSQDLDLDIYGARDHGFRRWRSLAAACATSGRALLPYRYYFDAENNASAELLHREDRRLPARRDAVLLLGLPEPRLVLRSARVRPPRARGLRRRPAPHPDGDRCRRVAAAVALHPAEKERILDDYQFFPTTGPRARPRATRGGAGTSAPTTARSWRAAHRRSAGGHVRRALRAPRRAEPKRDARRRAPARLDRAVPRGGRRAAPAAARGIRDCIVATDADPVEPIERYSFATAFRSTRDRLAQPGRRRPSALLRPGGRLDPARVRANLISLPLAADDERRTVTAVRAHGARDTSGRTLRRRDDPVRRGRDDVYGFYHLCTINTWRDVLAEQAAALGRLRASSMPPPGSWSRSSDLTTDEATRPARLPARSEARGRPPVSGCLALRAPDPGARPPLLRGRGATRAGRAGTCTRRASRPRTVTTRTSRTGAA